LSTGYSKKPLVQKLGIREGYEVAFLNQPSDYPDTLGTLPKDVAVFTKLKRELDFIQIFAKEKVILEKKLPGLKASLKLSGMLWVSWPKASSGVNTNLTEGHVREIGLKSGLVDVKICAIDETWSGLKFVRRLKDRC
jgi:hypothetical protein